MKSLGGSFPSTPLITANTACAMKGASGLHTNMSYSISIIEVRNADPEIVNRQQYTGKYNRRCWVLDPLESVSWASPEIGMHKLYIPAYFRTENHVS